MSGYRTRSRPEPDRPLVPGASGWDGELSAPIGMQIWTGFSEDDFEQEPHRLIPREKPEGSTGSTRPDEKPRRQKPKRKFKHGDYRLTGLGRLAVSGAIAAAILWLLWLVTLILPAGIEKEILEFYVFLSAVLGVCLLATFGIVEADEGPQPVTGFPVWLIGVAIAFILPSIVIVLAIIALNASLERVE